MLKTSFHIDFLPQLMKRDICHLYTLSTNLIYGRWLLPVMFCLQQRGSCQEDWKRNKDYSHGIEEGWHSIQTRWYT